MKVRVLENATPGEVTRVDSGKKSWRAAWAGEFSIESGAECDVEVEIGDIIEWLDQGDCSDNEIGISSTEGKTVICGRVSTVEDDGFFTLDLQPGVLLMDDDDLLRPVRVGELVCFIPGKVSIFPTGI